MDLEKLITTNPIWDFFTETFDLLSARPFENLVRRGGYGFYLFPKNGRYQDLGTRILVPGSWYQDLWGNRSLHDGGTALSTAHNRYPFVTVRTPQASLVGELRLLYAKHTCLMLFTWKKHTHLHT